MMRVHHLLAMVFAVLIAADAPTGAQEAAAPAGAQEAAAPEDPRAETGGAQTLEDILRRQRGEEVDNDFRRDDIGEREGRPVTESHLGVLGGASDSEVYRALRFNRADVTVSTRAAADDVLVQDDGMWWLELREGPVAKWGGYSLLGMLGVLVLFYLLRGRIRIDGPKTGVTIERFNALERFGHWLLAGSFILLALSGLWVLFGRLGLIDLIGKEAYAFVAGYSKWVHNNVAWAFMLGLVWVFAFWVIQNIPNRHDVVWMLKGGGLFSKDVHPPAKKFNAGQKIIFWAVIILGVSVSASGLSLLFPFDLPMFAVTFEKLNALGLPGLLGMEPFPTVLTPHAEMQYAQLWHTIVAFAMMAIILAHIYLGSVGMEGAFDAMGSGQVETQWAKEHHGLWVEELEEKGEVDSAGSAKATPAQ